MKEIDWRAKVEISNDHNAGRAKFLNMLSEFQHVWEGHLSRIKAAKHRIKLTSGGDWAFHSAPYRVGPVTRQSEKHETGRMVAVNVFEPAQTECAARIVFEPKKDGTFRFWVDYSQLIAVPIWYSFSTVCMDGSIDFLCDDTILLIFDTCSRYWQVKVADEARNKTAFAFHQIYPVFFECHRPKHQPGTFQCAMDITACSVEWQLAMVHLDDTIIFQSPQTNIDPLAES